MIQINVYYHKENYDYDEEFDFSLLSSEKYNTLTTLSFMLIETSHITYIKQIDGINIPTSFGYSTEFNEFMKVLNDSFHLTEWNKKSYFINLQNIWIMNKAT